MTPNFNYNRVSLIDHEKRNALTLKEETLKNKKLNLWKRKMNIQQPPTAAAPPALPQWESEANTLNLQGDHRRLYELLRDFHSFNRQQCATLRAEGYSSLSDLVNWKHKDIRSLLENLSNRPSSRGGQQFGARKSRNYKPCVGSLPIEAAVVYRLI